MSRGDFALILLVALIAAIAFASTLTVRYARYRKALAHGRRHVKPVKRPFWMD